MWGIWPITCNYKHGGKGIKQWIFAHGSYKVLIWWFFFHHTCSHTLVTGWNKSSTIGLETSKAFALSLLIHFCIWGCLTASWASADCWIIVKTLKHNNSDFAVHKNEFIMELEIDYDVVYLWSLLAKNCRVNILLSCGVSRYGVKPFLQANSCSCAGSLMWRCAGFGMCWSWTVFTADSGQHETWDLSIRSWCPFSWHLQMLFISWSWQINSLESSDGRNHCISQSFFIHHCWSGLRHTWRHSLCLHLCLDKVLKVGIFNVRHLHQSRLCSRHLPLFVGQTSSLAQNHLSRVTGVLSEWR